MTVHIGEKHLKKSDKRKTYSDKLVQGFALRTTPLGSCTFYFQYLNKATGKRDWHLIGAHPEWSIERARNEARGFAGLVAKGQNIKLIRNQQIEQTRVSGVTFRQLHDEYIEDCKQPMKKRWGMKPRVEGWSDVRAGFKRPLEWWGNKLVTEITDIEIMELLASWVKAGHVPMANRVRTALHTLFEWARVAPRKWITVNPCSVLPPKLDEGRNPDDARVLSADEIRTFWHGVDDPACPGDRLSKLALKLSLVTGLRTGEIVAIKREDIADDRSSVTIPLAVQKGRRSKMARPVEQPLNSLARAIINEVFAGDENRTYAFPGTFGRRGMSMKQQTLAHILCRKSSDAACRAGIIEHLKMDHWTPHTLRRTASTILEQLGYDEGLIGRILTHKTAGKDSSPITRKHYLVAKPIIARPVDPRVKALDDLDTALREILNPPKPKLKLVTAA
jgi:integrase